MKIHPSQLKTLGDKLVSVNYQDQMIGPIAKKLAHENSYNFKEDSRPHRAFSVFLFDNKNRLLLQQRSEIKITFANLWTNSCCSHQLFRENDVDKYGSSLIDAKARVKFELNFEVSELQLIKKILYKARGIDPWGEYELDYIYFGRIGEYNVKPNPEEVQNTVSLTREEFSGFINKNQNSLTPWFKLISESVILQWWEAYEQNKLRETPETIDSYLN